VSLPPIERALVALACLAGLLGVAASAAAAHGAGADTLRTAAQFLLFHAPAVIGLTILSAVGLARPVLARLAAGLMVAGLCLFCGDLALRALAGRALFPMAAPAGGLALMAGWLAGILCVSVPVRR
jgi:uncharacterized membrane protein YgdD (TMEM256/DUF423 family)